MPLYLDIHKIPGADSEGLRKAHLADVEVQKRHGVDFQKYWFDEKCGKAFCLVEAPSAEAAEAVHRESHGLMAERIIEIDPELAEGFLGGGEVNDAGAVLEPGSRDGTYDTAVRSIMFTDIVGSTEICSRHGDEAAMEVLSVHDTIVRSALKTHGGREIKHTGDGIMSAFFSAAGAVRCACDVQHDLVEHNQQGQGHPVVVRIGIAAGEPVEQHEDLFGSTVQLAARLCNKAEPGQILVSGVVADLCIGKGLKFLDAGVAELKGFDGPVPTRAVELAC